MKKTIIAMWLVYYASLMSILIATGIAPSQYVGMALMAIFSPTAFLLIGVLIGEPAVAGLLALSCVSFAMPPDDSQKFWIAGAIIGGLCLIFFPRDKGEAEGLKWMEMHLFLLSIFIPFFGIFSHDLERRMNKRVTT